MASSMRQNRTLSFDTGDFSMYTFLLIGNIQSIKLGQLVRLSLVLMTVGNFEKKHISKIYVLIIRWLLKSYCLLCTI